MAELDFLKREKKLVSYEAGKTVFSNGDSGSEFYAIVEGEIELSLNGRVIESLGEGGIFGEMALIDHEPRSATAVAKKDSRLAVIDNARFQYLVQNTPHFALQVMQVMAKRLRLETQKKT